MSDWDEDALREINSLDSARLAIRGALSTIQNLQEQNAKFKAEIQEQAASRKMLESRILELDAQARRWQEQSQLWEEQDKERLAREETWRNAVRLEIRSEERVRIGQAQSALEEELSRLRAEVGRMAQAQKEKDSKWAELKKSLESYQAELVRAEREKIELSQRYHQESETLNRLRERREREIAANLRRFELEIEDSARGRDALKRENEEFKKQLAGAALELEKKLREREEVLLRDFRIKEQSLHERYSKREMELESSWSELENGLWQKAKAARDTLDAVAEGQFVEKGRALAERGREIEKILLDRQQELQDEYAKKCTELESSYAQKERGLKESWEGKEQRFLKKFEEELSREKALIEIRFAERQKAVEAERKARLEEFERAKQELEADYRHRNSRVLEDAARREAERIRAQDDFIAKKTADLEAAFETRERERTEQFIAKTQAAQADLNRRRLDLSEEQAKAVAAEKEAVEKRFEDKARALDADYEAKILELARARQAMEREFVQHKASLAEQYALKEKNLDRRWAVREQEIVESHAGALDLQRRDFAVSARKMEEEFEAVRKRMEADLNEAHARKEQELISKYESLLSELREGHRRELQYQIEKGESEKGRLREDARAQIAAIKEELGKMDAQTRESAVSRELRIKALEEKVAESEKARQKIWETSRRREKEWESQKLALEESAAEHEALRERKHMEAEQFMRQAWAKREAEAVEARLKALEEQHRHYLDQIGRNEERLRAQFEEWKKEWARKNQAGGAPGPAKT
ncbi:MAG: coiled-coil domain-containing protein [Elusimicrobiota bacterium]